MRRRSACSSSPRPPSRRRDAGHVDRARQVVDHRVQQRLHALVLERGAAQHRTERAGDRAGLDATLQCLDRDVALVEILLHRRVIDRQRGVQQELAVFLGLLGEIGRDRFDRGTSRRVRSPPRSMACISTRSTTPRNLSSMPIGSCSGSATMSSFSFSVANARKKSAPVRSSLLMKMMRGNVVAVGEAPVGLRLRLHAGDALDDEDRAVQHAQAAVHLDVEVDVARRVDDVDPVVLPLAGHRGRGDGDAPLTLLLHVIGRGVAVVHLADAV